MPTLIELIRSNRTEALSKIYEEHRIEFIAWAIKTFNCTTDEAKDSYQNAIIILYENIVGGKLTELNSTLKTYLFAIGKNKLRELKREETKKESLEVVPQLVDEEETALSSHEIALAVDCLKQLGEPCQSLLQEFFYHKSTMVQIMEKFGYKNEDTAKNQKYKCLVRLRKIFHERNARTA
jgi:RNA polymerase sigma factor (sigma-70 family)